MNSGNELLFSIVVPTFGRPDEVTELIHSLEKQTYGGFELILADGSKDDSVKNVVQQRSYSIPVTHLHEPGLGISESRNWGVRMAKGTYIVFFDSDCVIPPQYFAVVHESLSSYPVDAWGGPDRAHEDFNNRQKAISYAMTSLFTTGGIRGRKNQAGRYQPRSFNFGIRKDVFDALGGFSGLKVSEDIDLSIRLYDSGKKVKLLVDAYVFHKRRSTWYKFFRQVHSFGSGRIDLQVRHRHALKLVHLLPAAFTLYLVSGIGFAFAGGGWWLFWLCTLISYCMSILVDSTLKNGSPAVGILSVYASFVMLTGYGTGMMGAIWRRFVMGSNRESEKPEITKES
jgi:glycosyltransferase involved in cell wall biosynthesis